MFDKFSYNDNRGAGRSFRLRCDFTDIINGIMIAQSLNKIKEIELKRKINSDKKVKVCFLIDNIAKLSTIPIYKVMLKHDMFEPFIIIGHETKYGNPKLKKEWQNTYNTYIKFKEKNYNVYFAYDENYNVIPLEKYKPDIVFTSAAYLNATHSGFTNLKLNMDYLVCFVNYALNTVNYYDYHYNNSKISSCWKYFVETVEDFNELTLFSSHLGTNAVLTGYPKLDEYSKPIENCKLPEKIDNGKPVVIYAPHWTVQEKEDETDFSTFLSYHKYFLNLAKKNTNINFVFKPHPTLMDELRVNNYMTEQEYDNYVAEWENLPNGICITSGSYIDLFRRSDLLITDCGSFIGEWLPTEKPCMYLVKQRKNNAPFMDKYSMLGRKILEKYYLCHNEKDIEKYLNQLIFDKADPMKEDRIKLLKECFINIGCASEKIVEYLENILKD